MVGAQCRLCWITGDNAGSFAYNNWTLPKNPQGKILQGMAVAKFEQKSAPPSRFEKPLGLFVLLAAPKPTRDAIEQCHLKFFKVVPST